MEVAIILARVGAVLSLFVSVGWLYVVAMGAAVISSVYLAIVFSVIGLIGAFLIERNKSIAAVLLLIGSLGLVIVFPLNWISILLMSGSGVYIMLLSVRRQTRG